MMSDDLLKPYFFLSYSRKDKVRVAQFQTDLENRGFSIWRDNSLQVGDYWERVVRQRIKESRGVIYFATRDAYSSEYVGGELALADMYNRKIFPIWADNEREDAFPLKLLGQHCIDIRDTSYHEGLKILQDNLHTFLSQKKEEPVNPVIDDSGTGPLPQPEKESWIARIWKRLLGKAISGNPLGSIFNDHVDEKNPYKGLQPFETADNENFYGRTPVIRALAQELQRIIQQEQQSSVQDERDVTRCLTVIGPSGSGKSSVVMAGLLPYLSQGKYREHQSRGRVWWHDLEGSQKWLYLKPVKPGQYPMQSLLQVLASYNQEINELKRVLLDDEESTLGLYLVLQRMALQHRRVVLFIDQFEELFAETVDRIERDRFMKLLLTTAREPDNKVLIVTTIRADFTDHLMYNQDLYRMMETHRVAIPPMRVDELRDVIVQPALHQGVRFENDALVGDLLFEMRGQEEALPLLQFTLQQLFETREQGQITQAAYDKLGGLSGAVGRYADRVYSGLEADQRVLAKDLFTHLVNPGQLDREATRRRAFVSELNYADDKRSEQMKKVADIFINARLLVSDNSTVGDQATLELVHESLILSWQRLKRWIEEAREDIRYRQTFNNDRLTWKEHHRPWKQLYRGQRLSDARAWSKRVVPNKDEELFLRDSTRYKYFCVARNTFYVVFVLLLILAPLNYFYNRNLLPVYQNTVKNLYDSGPGSLRQMIKDAQPDSTITFQSFGPGLSGTIPVMSGDLVLTKNVTIDGEGAHIALSNAGKSQSRIIIDPSATVTFKNISFINSVASETGFIDNQGNLTIDNGIIAYNTTHYSGGGIYSVSGSLILNDSYVFDNVAQGNGGGIYSWSGSVTLSNSKVCKNIAFQNGGGMYVQGSSLLLNRNSAVSLNRAGQQETVSAGDEAQSVCKGIAKQQNRELTDDGSNNGGGISVLDGVLVLDSSSVTTNSINGYGGGVALLGSTGFINQAQIALNNADDKGGGLAVEVNSENLKPSLAVLNGSMVVADQPQSFYYIGRNTAGGVGGAYQNVLGKTAAKGTPQIINSDDSEINGNPPPRLVPEKTKAFRGTVDWEGYCRSLFPDTEFPATITSAEMTDAAHIRCVLLKSDHVQISAIAANPSVACQWQYQTSDIMSRLADYFDASSWQCYEHVGIVGKVGEIASHFDAFCKSEHYVGAALNTRNNPNAYDWQCVSTDKSQAGLSVGDACYWYYHDQLGIAGAVTFETLTNYQSPYGWSCLTATS
jgi:hypothetical protein